MADKKVHSLQHVPYEGIGRIEDFFADRSQYQLSHTRLWNGEPLPQLEDFDVLLVMGGAMGVYDEEEFPWLVEEKVLIQSAIEAGKRVLGVCLGAQLIALALGGEVSAGIEREIGFHSIDFPPVETASSIAYQEVLSRCPLPLHWHGDVIAFSKELPSFEIIASSEVCTVQAFSAAGGRVLGTQYHLEIGAVDLEPLIKNSAEDLRPAALVQEAGQIREQLTQQEAVMGNTLAALLETFLEA